MKIIDKIMKHVLFKRDLKLLKKAFRDNLLSGGTLILNTKDIPIQRLVGVLTAYISSTDENLSLVVLTDNIKQAVIESFEGAVPCMTLLDFKNNIELYSYEGKKFIFLPIPMLIQSEVYDLALNREFKVLFCE